MDMIQQILASYCGLILMLTFHEVGHAWMAWKCGDDTARNAGRVSLNPLVHLDLVGTVIIPLLTLGLAYNHSAAAGFLIGWAKPVPVNVDNLRSPRRDDILISMAGPAMNLVLAFLLAAVARLFFSVGMGLEHLGPYCLKVALTSLVLCYFNLIPIPPLDGSHVLRVLIGMSRETYARLANVGFVVVILVMQIPVVRDLLIRVTGDTYKAILKWFHLFG